MIQKKLFLVLNIMINTVGIWGLSLGHFLAIYNLFKNKTFYGCNIQVSVHLSSKLRNQHIYHIGDIPSSTAPVFGLGHNMGHFFPFVLGSTQLLHHFLGPKK